jgi:hypothetical protein
MALGRHFPVSRRFQYLRYRIYHPRTLRLVETTSTNPILREIAIYQSNMCFCEQYTYCSQTSTTITSLVLFQPPLFRLSIFSILDSLDGSRPSIRNAMRNAVLASTSNPPAARTDGCYTVLNETRSQIFFFSIRMATCIWMVVNRTRGHPPFSSADRSRSADVVQRAVLFGISLICYPISKLKRRSDCIWMREALQSRI